MKYTESSHDRKSAVNTGLYVIIGLCLLIIGGASWFALTRGDDNDTTPSVSSSNPSAYSTPSTSYNESVLEPPYTTSTPIADTVSDQPYSSESETSSKTETQTVVFTMPVQGEILKKHSDSELQYSATYGDMRLHTGIDIACKKGTSVSACSDGTVTSIELNTTYGNVVTIDHKNGITVKYACLDNLKIENGATVKAGDIIGTVGTVPAECMDEEHLHLEVLKNGKSVEPLKALGLE
ncbi:MAG: M23 family metallopeptidase [Clostridia bacterium]|nr:M23 family metallopeptidase [Clostridia bacterium]MEE1055248.1 M23 family metallopeptidase [Acutalibacteraceae bacterium]